MAQGNYSIQFLLPGDRWKTSLRMQRKGREFMRGCMFALKELQGGGVTYRLVKHLPDGTLEELDRRSTGNVQLNSTPEESSE